MALSRWLWKCVVYRKSCAGMVNQENAHFLRENNVKEDHERRGCGLCHVFSVDVCTKAAPARRGLHCAEARRLHLVNVWCTSYSLQKKRIGPRIQWPARATQGNAARGSRRIFWPLISMYDSSPPSSDGPSVGEELARRQARSPLFSRPGFLIRRMHQIHTSLFTEETQGYNITPVQYSLMTTLDAQGEVDQNTLAVEVGLERSSVAEVIPRLHARGLIARTQAKHDKRMRLVSLTTSGKRLVRKMGPAVQRAHDRTIEQLTPAEQALFMLLMIRLVESNNTGGVVPLRLTESLPPNPA